jgi:NtrC-family two-component system response regulator AlgB
MVTSAEPRPPETTTPQLRVLVVDDEKNIRAMLGACLEVARCDVKLVASAAAAVAEARRSSFHLAIVDLRLGNESGLDLIPALLEQQRGLLIVIITAYADFGTAVEAIKRGAWDFLAKPFTPAQVRHLVSKAADQLKLAARVADLESQLSEVMPGTDLSTRSRKMRPILDIMARVADTEATVLLRGENGTGKGVVARAIHDRSPRSARPFVVVHCPTLTEELLTSELFGHRRGAFTGAVRDQEGRVETAEGGTLFLDEIGDISPALQAKLLRFLQDRTFERIGEQQTRHADVRIIAATNRNLEEAVTAGRFREDLLYRLNVVEICLPPLRERPEDIVPLAQRFAAAFARANRRAVPVFSPAAQNALTSYPWPGNVRELRNAVERALILWPAQVIEPAAFPERIEHEVSKAPWVGGTFTLEAIEREHIARVLESVATLDEAARVLGIDASTLYRKRKRGDVRET